MAHHSDKTSKHWIGAGQFHSTHWSVVLAAGGSDQSGAAEALEKLCRAYWYPLYVYVRRQNSPEDAQDLTQDSFARLLEKNYLARAEHDRGKFRTFLLGSLKTFMVNEWKRAGRLKRGGGLEFLSIDANVAEDCYASEPANESNPDAAYEQRWAVTLIEQVLTRGQENILALLGVKLVSGRHSWMIPCAIARPAIGAAPLFSVAPWPPGAPYAHRSWTVSQAPFDPAPLRASSHQ